MPRPLYKKLFIYILQTESMTSLKNDDPRIDEIIFAKSLREE